MNTAIICTSGIVGIKPLFEFLMVAKSNVKNEKRTVRGRNRGQNMDQDCILYNEGERKQLLKNDSTILYGEEYIVFQYHI